jgi:exoribonuclease R
VTVRFPTEAVADLADGFAQIRAENKVARSFPAAALEAAEAAIRRPLGSEHVDCTDLPFVTLDPASSTDLDQAFMIETAGADLILRYAIADVPWFVRDGDAMDTEAWSRGVTDYLPDGRAGLYPPVLSEGAASLLPDGPRPAVVFIVRVANDGSTTLDAVQRSLIRSRAKLAYNTAAAADLPAAFEEFGRRIAFAEDQRGASRVETPEQEVVNEGNGRYHLEFRPRLANEEANAAMSLATNVAVAEALFSAHTGLFRIMPEPDQRRVQRLRYTAKALGLSWASDLDLRAFQRTLVASDPQHAAFLFAVRRASGGADYAPYAAGVKPWHSAMAATYCHTTAPLRRLADRYVVAAALAVGNGKPVPDSVSEAFTRLPDAMDLAETRSSRVERAVIDLIETVSLVGQEGTTFNAVVTDQDERGARIQLCDMAVVARVATKKASPGDELRVRLVSANVGKRELTFERLS